MELRELMREWRIWVLVIALLLSTIWISPGYEQRNGEVVITTALEDRTGIDFSGGTRLLLDVQTNATGAEQEKVANQVRDILQIRVSNFGLGDASIRTVRIGDEHKIQIQVPETNQTRLRKLISQEGSFEARMPIKVADAKNFSLENEYRFNRANTSVTVTGPSGSIGTFEPGDSWKLENTTFYYVNNTERYANLEVVAYSGQDIQEVLTSQSMVRGGSQGYSAQFQVLITKEAARNVQQVASNYNSLGEYLTHDDGSNAKLRLYVDENRENALNIASVFAQQIITQPSIQTGGETEAAARESMKRLQAILQSGQLPAPVRIETVSTLSSSLGSQFMAASVLSILASLLAVGTLVFVRYRDPLLVVPIVLTGASEVYILLGFWSWFTPLGSLSLAAIAGIIAAVGTGVDDQIIITDESGQESVAQWSQRMKRAFFVIFTSAASTIGAMSPILLPSLASLMIGFAGAGLIGYTLYTRGTNAHYLVIGSMAVAVSVITSMFSPSGAALQNIHGFASTTILGIMIGISITRPAYATVLEYMNR
ncbi:MAG: hypothetical protein ABEJ69_00435 [Candidatus Nanohaloarchaea archaeon]